MEVFRIVLCVLTEYEDGKYKINGIDRYEEYFQCIGEDGCLSKPNVRTSEEAGNDGSMIDPSPESGVLKIMSSKLQGR